MSDGNESLSQSVSILRVNVESPHTAQPFNSYSTQIRPGLKPELATHTESIKYINSFQGSGLGKARSEAGKEKGISEESQQRQGVEVGA